MGIEHQHMAMQAGSIGLMAIAVSVAVAICMAVAPVVGICVVDRCEEYTSIRTSWFVAAILRNHPCVLKLFFRGDSWPGGSRRPVRRLQRS